MPNSIILNRIPFSNAFKLSLKDRLNHHYTLSNDETLSLSALMIFI